MITFSALAEAWKARARSLEVAGGAL